MKDTYSIIGSSFCPRILSLDSCLPAHNVMVFDLISSALGLWFCLAMCDFGLALSDSDDDTSGSSSASLIAAGALADCLSDNEPVAVSDAVIVDSDGCQVPVDEPATMGTGSFGDSPTALTTPRARLRPGGVPAALKRINAVAAAEAA